MKDEKAAFSERLRAAMRAQDLEPTASELEKLFNTHYEGKSVSVQSVGAWLRGASIPKQDKLRVLADVLGIEPQRLHYGESGHRISEKPVPYPRGTTAQDRAAIEALLALPAAHRKLISELIRALTTTED